MFAGRARPTVSEMADRPVGVQIQFTIGDAAVGDDIVERLLAERSIACGQRLGPVHSRFRWLEAIESATEYLYLLKTKADLSDQVCAAICAAHPYDVPEVIVLPILGGLAAYLEWIDTQTRDANLSVEETSTTK